MKKVILIDGNNLMFRSYFATAYSGAFMKNQNGMPTNGLYGFTSMINKIINEEKPEYMVVAFDVGKNFRHDKYASYKAGRNETPNELKVQMPYARKILDALGIKHLELEGYEADDIIGTLAKEADLDPDYDALIVSSDHDLMQLISPVVSMKLLKSKDYKYLNVESFKEEYGFDPIKTIDLKSLMGDASDNIPGVKGIGEKTAISLLQKYGSLDGVYENIDNIKGKMKEKLELDKDNAYFSYELATIFRDVPLNVKLEDLTYTGVNIDLAIPLFKELGFQSLLKVFNQENKKEDTVDYVEIKKIEEINSAIEYSYYIECDKDNYHFANIIGMGLYDGNKMYYIDKNIIKDVIDKLHLKLRYTYSLKKNIVLMNKLGISDLNCDYDLMIAHYLLEENKSDDLSINMSYDGEYIYNLEDLYKNKVDIDKVKTGIVKKAKYIYTTRESVINKLKEKEMFDLFSKMEMPLVKVLASMELCGIKTNIDELNILKDDISMKLDHEEKIIKEYAGVDFNISSPKQLGVILFENLKLRYPAKSKGSYSTDISILSKIIDEHPIIEHIIKYRSLNKLYTSYIESLPSFIKEDNKIHTIYKQTLTRTGRLSSAEPNLQNIPTHEEEGRLIKKAFIAEDGAKLLSADYSQIELRILAHIANDEVMINAFNDGVDIHKRVASDIYGVSINDVTKEMRSTAKSVIFGIVYGISGYGLGDNLNISSKEAKNFIDKYYLMYPNVKKYMDNIKDMAYKEGYVKTLFGRIRTIDELKSPVYTVRSQGERIAFNTPIQGTGADIIKIAMIKLYNDLKINNLKSKIILQVHDEIILNVYDDEADIVKDLVKKNMESVVNFEMPLTIEMSLGNTWYDAK